MTMKVLELGLNELNDIVGGAFRKPREKKGFLIYQITATDTLIRIANKYGISDWRKIIDWNPHIDRKTNMIRTGEWLWIKK